MSGHDSHGRHSWKSTVLWMSLIFAVAFGVRLVFNVEASFDEGTSRYLYTTNDPFYHDRTVHHILDTGEQLIWDPAINYPHGAPNPNPPIFDWTTAPLAGLFEAGGMEQVKAVSLALNLMVTLWSALIVVPTFMVGKDLFGRKAGFWAAFFMAVSAPHMSRAVWGFADHDATTMFFIVLAVAFLVRALRHLERREYVSNWRQDAMAGIREAVRRNQEPFLWSILAGLALAGIALTWKGYPYLLAVMALGLTIQLLVDHARNRDSTAVFGIYLVPLILVAFLPAWYYTRFGSVFLPSTVHASLYVLAGALAVGAVLVPTRRWPSIVVFPGLVVLGIAGLALLWAMQNVWQMNQAWNTIFTGLGYFKQTKLYTTIGEAQRTDLGELAATFGFFAFILAFWFFGRSLRRMWKGDAAHTLMAAWAVVAFFMAFAAARFILNAAPVFAVLAGGAAAALAEKLGFADVRRRFRSMHGQNPVVSGVRSLNWKATVGAVALTAFVVVPNLWLGVDAATPNEFERDQGWSTQRWGAFGGDYRLRDDGWLSAMSFLATLDTDRPIEDRPGFLAWWDYGHYALGLGYHPTVADPFQNHYNVAGRFLASESEREAALWTALLLMDGDHFANDGYSPAVRQALATYAPNVTREARIGITNDAYAQLETALPGDDAFRFLEAVTQGGKEVRYLAVDRRMHADTQSTGIFYAPVFLAGKNPDDFVQTVYIGERPGGGTLRLQQQLYGMDATNNSYRLPTARFVDAANASREYVVIGGEAFPRGQVGPEGGIPVRSFLNPTEKYTNSMFRRAYGGPCAFDTPAGDGMEHWRVVHDAFRVLPGVSCTGGAVREVALLEYYRGVPVSGRVTDEFGAPVVGFDVAFRDGSGALHGRGRTDANGNFSVVAPFSIQNATYPDGDLQLVALQSGAVIAQTAAYQFTREQARAGTPFVDASLVIPNVDVRGRVWEDLDGNNAFNATLDRVLPGARVTVGSREAIADENGNYTLADMQPGATSSVTVLEGYSESVNSLLVSGTTNVTVHDIRLQPAPVSVTYDLRDQDGNPLAGLPLRFQGTAAASATSNANGTVATTLVPGDYEAIVDTTRQVNETMVRYQASERLVVPFNGDPITRLLVVQRTIEDATTVPNQPGS